MASTQLVRMPMAAAMPRFWVTARISRPKRVRRMMMKKTQFAHQTEDDDHQAAGIGTVTESTEPLIQGEVETLQLLGPKMADHGGKDQRDAQAASSFPSGRP